MNKQIDIIRNVRKTLLNVISELTTEELNKVPTGFNNNIIWNLAHMTSAQQSACYMRAGVPLVVEEKYFLDYKPDTRPGPFVDDAEIQHIKQIFLSVIDQLEIDYANNLFSNYTPWTNRYNAQINTIDEMLGFLPFHEGFHYGYIVALKRIIQPS